MNFRVVKALLLGSAMELKGLGKMTVSGERVLMGKLG